MNSRRIGIDLGGTKIEGVVLDNDGSILERHRVPTERDLGYDHILTRITELAAQLRASAPDARRIGIGTPGSLSSRDRTLKNSNTVCLNGRPFLDDLGNRLRSELGLEVVLENDANCFALAEALAGSGRGHELVFGVILGTGVGGGIVHRGEIWSGPQHIAGEWGHHRISDTGPDCYCGRRGCVESFLSGPALERAYREQTGSTDSIRSAEEIAARARAGDATAIRVLDDYLETFGRALANVINILDPSVIVLGGGLSNLDELYTRGRAAVERWVFNDELRTQIVRNSLGDSAGVIGAALLSAQV